MELRRAAQVALARLPWVLFGAILHWSSSCQLVPHWRCSHQLVPPTRRHLRQLEPCSQPVVAPELEQALGVNGSVLLTMQAELVRRLTRSGTAWHWVGPLKPYYPTAVQDGYARLHQLLFDVKLLPLSSWGGRFDFERPLRSWLQQASTVGRGGKQCQTSRSCMGGTLSRLGLNMFLLRHAPRVLENATCLGVDVATQYPPVIPGYNARRT